MIDLPPIEKRIEEKFFLPKSKSYAFMSLINNLDAKKLHPNRKVQSLYLDYNNTCFGGLNPMDGHNCLPYG